MEQYTIYCTEEQTKKALELGAPIRDSGFGTEFNAINPTAEQMINWLEETLGEYSSVYVEQDSQGWWSAKVYDSCNYRIFHSNDYNSRKEATLAAIDAALDYLINKKGE